jgi:hypothetical protein
VAHPPKMKEPRSACYVERPGAQLHLSYRTDRFDKLSYRHTISSPPFDARVLFRDEICLAW